VDLKSRLEDLAKSEGVPISQMVAFLLYEPVFLLEQKRISLWGYKSASRSPKYESNLDLNRKSEEVSQNG
jgi:class 3 adenylate cyclase